MSIAPELLRRIVEGALLAAGQPLSEDRLLSLIDEGERPERAQLLEALQQIADSCTERGFELRQVASGWRFQVPEDLAPWVNRLWEEKPQKYSRAILETLAIIAYRQPITRGDIEEIRGVAVSSHIVRTLAERGWVKVVGQRDVPGKPSLYATTREFLDYFNLRTLDDLPTLAEIRDIDSLNRALDLGELTEDESEVDSEVDETDGAGQADAENADSPAGEEDPDGDRAEEDQDTEPSEVALVSDDSAGAPAVFQEAEGEVDAEIANREAEILAEAEVVAEGAETEPDSPGPLGESTAARTEEPGIQTGKPIAGPDALLPDSQEPDSHEPPNSRELETLN